MKTFCTFISCVVFYLLVLSCSWNDPFKPGHLNYLGPEIVNVNPVSGNTIELNFNTNVNPEDALNYGNYSIYDLTIDNIVVLSETNQVRLTTGTQEKDKIYTLVVQNIRDEVYGIVIVEPYNEKDFIGINLN